LTLKTPGKLKQVIDEMLTSSKPSQGGENEAKVFLKVVFLYFFELLGVEDEASLKVLFDFVLARNSNTGKMKELTKAQQ